MELPSPVASASLSARPPYRCVVSLASGPPLLVDLESSQEQQLPLLALGGWCHTCAGLGVRSTCSRGGALKGAGAPAVCAGWVAQGGAGTVAQTACSPLPCPPAGGAAGGKDAGAAGAQGGQQAVAAFNSSGDTIFIGHARGGLISVLDTASLQYLDVVKVGG